MSIVRQIIIVLIFIPLCNINAQDIHFSQFDYSPLNLNAANAGNFDGNYRGVLNNRNQWQSFTNGYRTFSASADLNFPISIFNNSFGFGTGIILNSDKAGDGNFGINQLQIAGALHYKLKKETTVSFGVSAGFVQNAFNFNKYYFNSQYNGEHFDPNIGSGEIPASDQLSYFDASTGFAFSYIFNKRETLNSGISITHLNSPKVSFYDNNSVTLKQKVNFHTTYFYDYSESVKIIPAFLFSRQGNQTETVAGISAELLTGNITVETIHFGTYLRWKDAIVLSTGFLFKKMRFGLSYDVNYSKLRQASNGKGGFEFSLIYIFKRSTAPKFDDLRQCPVFI